jgi:RNA polymerase sigma-70 factor (family 1)
MISQATVKSAPLCKDMLLAQEIKRGNKTAFTDLFDAYYKPLCDYAYRFCDGDTEAVEDLVQEIFVRIWERRDSWNPQIAVRAYLYRSVHNQAISNIRKKRFETPMTDGLVNSTMTNDLSPIARIHNTEIDDAIKTAISMLPERRREILVLRLLHDMSYKDISRILGISVNTVDTQLRRALKLLREQLYYLHPADTIA